MPLVRMHTFNHRHFGSLGRPVEFFQWVDDPAEDAAFAAFVARSSRMNNPVVDRSGFDPVLRWEDDDANPQELELDRLGDHWNVHDTSEEPERIDTVGYWKCDYYGRPYDLNDLLA